ncbi:MAG TPA: tetratricopeptide repeat protein [Anaerolineaceae bacterium]
MFQGLFKKPPERLLDAITRARQTSDRNRAANDLRAAIDKEAQEVIAVGAVRLVVEAYSVLADLQARNNQVEAAFLTLEKLRKLDPIAADNLGLRIVGEFETTETDLMKLSNWLEDDNRLAEAADPLRKAVEERFRRSPSLLIRLGDALAAGANYGEAAQRYHAGFDLRPAEASRVAPKLQAITQAAPRTIQAWETLGNIHFLQGNFQFAADNLAAARALGKISEESLFQLVDSYFQMGHWELALEGLEHLLSLSANEAEIIRRCEAMAERVERPGLLYQRAQRTWGDALRSQQRYDEALICYRNALDDLFQDQADTNQEMGVSLEQRLRELATVTSDTRIGEAKHELARALLVVGNAPSALEEAVGAVESDPQRIIAETTFLQEIIARNPGFQPAWNMLVQWQIKIGNLRGALDSLESLRRQQSEEDQSCLPLYRDLLKNLEILGEDGTLVKGHNREVLAGVLFALAELTARKSPSESLAHLDRILLAFQESEAREVLEHIQTLKLAESLPLNAHLIEGDAWLALGEYTGALEAYEHAPLNPQSAQKIVQRLVKLAGFDASRPDAWISAAKVEFAYGQPERLPEYLEKAWLADRERTTPVVIEQLGMLFQKKRCPIAGLPLLAQAYLYQNCAEGFKNALQVLNACFKNNKSQAAWVAEQCRLVLAADLIGDHEKEAALLLLGDSLVAQGLLEDGAQAYRRIVEIPQSNYEKAISMMQNLAKTAPDNIPILLLLADAYWKAPVRNLDKGLAIFQRILEVDSEAGKRVLHQLTDGLKENSELEQIPGFHLVRIRALIHSGQVGDALNAIRQTVERFGEAVFPDLAAVEGMLPETVDCWFLREEMAVLRGQITTAGGWLDQIVAAGNDREVRRADAILQELAEKYVDIPRIRLSLARARQRLGRLEDAARICRELAEESSDIVPEALEMLNQLAEKTADAGIRLAQAQGHFANNNLRGALDAIEPLVAVEESRRTAHKFLRDCLAVYPNDTRLLDLLVDTELKLEETALFPGTLALIKHWLDCVSDSDSAQRVKAATGRLVEEIDGSAEPGKDLALTSRLLWVDTCIKAHEYFQANRILLDVLDGWKTSATQVAERCREILRNQDLLAVRVTLGKALIEQASWEDAYRVLSEGLSKEDQNEDRTTLNEAADCCGVVITHCVDQDRPLAGKVSLVQAGWLERLRDESGCVSACQRAAHYDLDLVSAAAEWLAVHSWDAHSHVVFGAGRIDLLISAGEAYFSEALRVSDGLLNENFGQRYELILELLKKFPDHYLPAWIAQLEIHLHKGVENYPEIYFLFDQMLEKFGSGVAPDLLSISERMDPAIPEVWISRARIFEALGDLGSAAEVLLKLQADQPETAPQVAQHLREFVARHPAEVHLLLFLGDSSCRAGDWNQGTDAYRQAQLIDASLAEKLIPRFQDVLKNVPGQLPAHWGLAEAHAFLHQSDLAAHYLNALTDLFPEEAHPADSFLEGLLITDPQCGAGWYVRGKLAFWKNDYTNTIEYLESSLTRRSVPEEWLCTLHNMLGQAYYSSNEFEQAQQNFRKAIVLSPDDPSLRSWLVQVRFAILDRQILVCREQVGSAPDHIPSLLHLAELLERRGDTEDAIALLQKALEDQPDHPGLLLALNRLFSITHRHHLAAVVAEQVRKNKQVSQADQKQALFRLSQSYRALLRFDEAASALESLLAIDAGYPGAANLLLQVQKEKALAQFQPLLFRTRDGISPIREA